MRKTLLALAFALCVLAQAAPAATADWLFTASGTAVDATSSTYVLGGPGMVAIRLFGIGGAYTGTVVLEEKLRDDEPTWALVATLCATSCSTTLATWNGTASGQLRVRAYNTSGGTLGGTIVAWAFGDVIRTVPR